jgi:hypothetical protein
MGCGGNAPAAHELPPQPSATPTPVQAPDAGAASVVRYDDLGISFAVPPGFHVMGDSELEARVRGAASVQLQADLRKHAGEKKGLPLLVLSRDGVYVTLSVVVVPADATPTEIMAQQTTAISENTKAFETTSPAKDITLDGIPGSAMSATYEDHAHRVSVVIRLYVRNGVATLLVAVWPDSAHGEDVPSVLDGLHLTARDSSAR